MPTRSARVGSGRPWRFWFDSDGSHDGGLICSYGLGNALGGSILARECAKHVMWGLHLSAIVLGFDISPASFPQFIAASCQTLVSLCCSSFAMLPIAAAAAAKRRRLTQKVAPYSHSFRASLGVEDATASQYVYLITMSRVLPGALANYRDLRELSRQDVCSMVRDAFDNPAASPSGAGRPRAGGQQSCVKFVAVAQESHEDGSPHFHVAVRLNACRRWALVKHTLMARHQVPSHWSCSHSQLWSALRYITVATPKKPVVDQQVFVWQQDGQPADLVAMSHEPWTSAAWRKRRETHEATAVAEDSRAPAFNKLDFMALIMSKHLHTKASLLAYVQDYASPAAQLFTSKNQRRVVSFIEDAQEWADAKTESVIERMTDWEILCRVGGRPCGHEHGVCPYAAAVLQIFHNNAGVMSPHRLATLLRSVICGGPSKTSRVPFLVGPSNTGKSTILYPFDDLFGARQVFHKPALGSTFALRNIANKKRFIFWDEFRPVEFAHHNTVPAATFLSLFIGKETEIQVSQSFNDGNLDIAWKRGAVFTAKEDGLWNPTHKVSAEDVRHLRNRVEQFRFVHVMPEGSFHDVPSCAPCMARWILQYSEEAATGRVPRPMLPAGSGGDSSGDALVFL